MAREITRRVASFPNYRARVGEGRWSLDPHAVFRVRPERECLATLSRTGVPATPIATTLTPIPAPVRIEGPVGGVRYHKRRIEAPFIVSCELAARLPALSAVLRRHRIHTAVILSGWRRQPRTSFHSFGMALDLYAFEGEGLRWDVEADFAADPRQPTCPAPPDSHPLRTLACELAESGHWNTVITPLYSPGHHNHYHIDIRPDDARVFLR